MYGGTLVGQYISLGRGVVVGVRNEGLMTLTKVSAAKFAASFIIGFLVAYSLALPTFLEKCRSDIQLSKNAGRIADALEKRD